MMQPPPCQICTAPQGKARTYVAKVSAGEQYFTTFGASALAVLGANAWATVRTEKQHAGYYCIVTGDVHKRDKCEETFKNSWQKVA